MRQYLATEFFLQLPNKAKMNLAESLPQSEGNIDNNGLAISRNIHVPVELIRLSSTLVKNTNPSKNRKLVRIRTLLN